MLDLTEEEAEVVALYGAADSGPATMLPFANEPPRPLEGTDQTISKVVLDHSSFSSLETENGNGNLPQANIVTASGAGKKLKCFVFCEQISSFMHHICHSLCVLPSIVNSSDAPMADEWLLEWCTAAPLAPIFQHIHVISTHMYLCRITFISRRLFYINICVY